MGIIVGLAVVFIVFWLIAKATKARPSGPQSDFRQSYQRPEYVSSRNDTALSQDHPEGTATNSSTFTKQWDRDQATPSSRTARWIAPGEAVTIAGFTITGGMIYVGGSLSAKYRNNDNCLINPNLPVARSGADTYGQSMDYWPAYESISGAARRAYLEWLAEGRSRPGAYIGYVFLFFYGLERRLFVDGKRDEAGVLVAEVERLLAIYGANGSFDMYARRFLDIARLFANGVPSCEPSLELRNGYEIPLGIRLALGEKLGKGEPFNAGEALTWVLALPDCFPRRPIQRCFDEAQELWRLRFGERYPAGLKVRIPKAEIKATYRPASACFDAQLSMPDMPDIAAVQAPLVGLKDLLHACADELDPYSRLLGRRPEAEGTPEALLLLPSALADSVAGTALQALRETLAACLAGQDLALVPVSEVMKTLGLTLEAGDRLAPGAARQMGAMLDRLDMGFEPDRRYGPISPALDGQIALFPASRGGPIDPDRPEHLAARTLVEVAVLAAQADGVVVPAELEAIAADLKGIDALGAEERLRLIALSVVLLKDPPKHQAAVNRLLKLEAPERLRITQAAISAVLADGRVTPEEVKFLERLHKALGLPQDQIYAALHRGGLRADEPVTVAIERRIQGEGLPPAPPAEAVVVAFDPHRLARIRQETSAVSQLLAGIFVDDEAVENPVQVRPKTSTSAFEGLDPAHASLLSTLLTMDRCDRATFENSARSLRLFPDGALETINEWGFDHFDEPVLEGEEGITPVEHLRARLQQMGAMG